MKYLILLAPLLLTACSNNDAISVTSEAVAYGTKLCEGSGGVKNFKAVNYVCITRYCTKSAVEFRVVCVNGLQGTYTLPSKE